MTAPDTRVGEQAEAGLEPDGETPGSLMVEVPAIGAPLAEAALLGCLLTLPAAPARALLARLAETDWVVPAHRTVAAAAAACLAAGVPADPVTVLGQLRRTGTEPSVERPPATGPGDVGLLLLDLVRAAPCPASATHYAQVVLEHAYRARLQTAAVRLLQAAPTAPLDGLTALLDTEIGAVTAAAARLTPPPAPAPTEAAPPARPDRRPGATSHHLSSRRRTG